MSVNTLAYAYEHARLLCIARHCIIEHSERSKQDEVILERSYTATVVAVWCSRVKQAASVCSARFSSLLQTSMGFSVNMVFLSGTTVLTPDSS